MMQVPDNDDAFDQNTDRSNYCDAVSRCRPIWLSIGEECAYTHKNKHQKSAIGVGDTAWQQGVNMR
jgi:hypothetical protein